MDDYTYYCPCCEWYWRLMEVVGKDLMDPRCPTCDTPLQSEVDKHETT